MLENPRRIAGFVQVEQPIGKLIEREADVVEPLSQSLEHVVELASARDLVPGDELIIGPPNLLVKFQVRAAAVAPTLGVLVKNATDEERVIPDVRTKQKCLLRCGASQRDQHIGNVFVDAVVDLFRTLQLVGARKSLEQRPDVIAKLAIADAGLLLNISGQDVEIELG